MVNATKAFESAAALFPAAQSPQLALSRLAAESGDEAGTRTLVDRLLAAGAHDEDPWWIYHRANGRDAAGFLQSFSERVRGVALTGPAGRQP